MFTIKEITWIIIAIVIFEFMVLFPVPKPFNASILLVPIIVILVNVIVKKIVSRHFSINIEHKVFEFERWGLYSRSHLKKAFPMGLVFPLVLTILSLGLIKPFFLLGFEYSDIPRKRILKEHGTKRKTLINDSDPGYVAAWGFFSLIVLAIIGAIFKFPELSKYAIYYGAWNLIPFGKLDGMKLFFGSILTYSMIAILYIISLLMVIIYIVY
ncbi:MAG: hypothetical protein Q8N99_04615 [Nanoarchaeota archaeon]|nr:hypothetical protein [Nanoarchaeota archaeon]